MIRQAIYGRRRVGKCLGSEEANTFEDPRYFGCSENVLHIVDAKCSGRKQCEISIPDPDLDGTSPCLPGLKMFLEVSYSCVEGNMFSLYNSEDDNGYCIVRLDLLLTVLRISDKLRRKIGLRFKMALIGCRFQSWSRIVRA